MIKANGTTFHKAQQAEFDPDFTTTLSSVVGVVLAYSDYLV